MEALDRLIQLSRLQGALDLRCVLSGNLKLDHAPAPPGEAFYHVVISGQCVLKLGDQPDILLAAGDIAMLPRGHAHLVEVHEKAEAGCTGAPNAMRSRFNGAVTIRTNCSEHSAELDLLCGRFSYAKNALLMDVLPEVVKVSFASADVPDLARIVETMRREAEQAEPGAYSIVSALSTALFTMLLRAWLAQQPSTAGVLALLANPRLGASIVAMLERPAERWTLDLLAQRSAMSRATYVRTFGALADDSPMALLARIRMQLASTLLTRTRKSIAEIADDVGYQSEAAFSKKFKETYDMGPGRFRQINS
jgi:AraC family transcriptional activator of mtrCDE